MTRFLFWPAVAAAVAGFVWWNKHRERRANGWLDWLANLRRSGL